MEASLLFITHLKFHVQPSRRSIFKLEMSLEPARRRGLGRGPGWAGPGWLGAEP